MQNFKHMILELSGNFGSSWFIIIAKIISVRRLSGLRDLVRGRQLLEVILKLFGICVKVKVQYGLEQLDAKKNVFCKRFGLKHQTRNENKPYFIPFRQTVTILRNHRSKV